jgi:hypothetical protein
MGLGKVLGRLNVYIDLEKKIPMILLRISAKRARKLAEAATTCT